MSTKKLLIYSGAFVGLLIVVLFVGKKAGWIGGNTSLEVTTSVAQRLDIVETVSASGKIYPALEVKISPDVSGEIIELNYEEGDSVQEEDLVVKIRPDIYQSLVNRADATLNQAKASLASAKARLTQAQAQFDNAKLIFDRNKKLFEEGVISQADYDNAVATFKTSEAELVSAKQNVAGSEYSVKSAEAALKEANDNLRQTTIYAPITGVISMLNVEKGERVVGTTQMAGTEMLRIADFSNMEVHVDVTESVITRVHVGDTAEVEVDAYYGRKFKGVVIHIANSATAQNQLLSSESVTNFTVKIHLLESSYADIMTTDGRAPFKPGMSASVEIYTAQEIGALGIPIQAVLVDEEPGKDPQEIIYLWNDGIAKKVPVKTGIQDSYFISITDGEVAEGDEIISGPYSTISRVLEDGDAVRKAEEDKKKR